MLARPEQLLLALIGEAAIGYPAWLLGVIGHPVIWIGVAIAALERRWNAGSALRRRAMGIMLLALVAGGAGAIGWLIEAWAGDGLAVGLVIVLATTGLAQRSLDDHVRAVAGPLLRGDVAAARAAVAMIVGRDTAALDEGGIAVAATESLAESFCDGVVAPAFWFLVAGLPGLLVCKVVNTADSMIGHRDTRYLHFGWAAARTDDLVNFIPARISGVLVCLAGMGGWTTMLRDARSHASPNGGWPEAAMAGVLGRRLGGPVSYDGEPAHRAWLGDGPAPDARDLQRALWVYRWACVLLWAMTGGLAWLL
ncbi:adenosylcobinamide-phosphate synthase CbiB [Blastomonas aquatica]|uniref:Cobalamin biosynthesis protein CobD n=1 Tax=Blastomonas aquatica TaxID=1510276 RepID=A0ABQ1JPW3_9SPHN|nr:adenosylcobinamide-phosphate synthase CbiB [Blastomonas aquatica]GGB71696.1 cobalamin biosynthesis protein CobD [Blastomonas aquatica]